MIAVDRVHRDHLKECERRTDARDAGSRFPINVDSVDRPPFAEREEDRPEKQPGEQRIGVAQHQRVPQVERENEHERERSHDPSVVANEQQDGEYAVEDEQRRRAGRICGEEVYGRHVSR